MNRLVEEPNIAGSSSFYNREVAENVVSKMLEVNQVKIADWLNGSAGRLRLDHTMTNPSDYVGIAVRCGAVRCGAAVLVQLMSEMLELFFNVIQRCLWVIISLRGFPLHHD
jgi:hypothetical protein